MQTLRFLTALVCSTTVTTAVAMPMAIKAMSYQPPAGLGAAASTQGGAAPADPPLPPPTTARTPAPAAVAGTAATSPAPAAPSTTAAPAPTTSTPATTATVAATLDTVAAAEEPAPTTAATSPAPPAPSTTAPPAPTTSAAPPSTADINDFNVTQPCGPNAHELDERQPGVCDPNANG